MNPSGSPVELKHSTALGMAALASMQRRSELMNVDELRELARLELAVGTDLIWSARIRLSALEQRGDRVTTAYRTAVRATEACDRALAKAPKTKKTRKTRV